MLRMVFLVMGVAVVVETLGVCLAMWPGGWCWLASLGGGPPLRRLLVVMGLRRVFTGDCGCDRPLSFCRKKHN